MKKILIGLILLASVSSYAQPESIKSLSAYANHLAQEMLEMNPWDDGYSAVAEKHLETVNKIRSKSDAEMDNFLDSQLKIIQEQRESRLNVLKPLEKL